MFDSFIRPLGVAVAFSLCVPVGISQEPAQNGGAQNGVAQNGVAAPRLWKDASGKFQIEASLVDQTATTVRLRAANGREVSVPRERLSAADQEYLKSLAAPIDNPFAAVMPQPKQNGASPTDGSQPTPGTLRAVPESSVVSASLALPDTGRVVDLTKIDSEDPFTPDPSAEANSPPSGTVAISSVDPYDRVAAPVAFDASGSKFLVSIGRNKAGSAKETRGRIYLADLDAKTTSLIWDHPESLKVLDHDPVTHRTLINEGLDPFERGGHLAVFENLDAGNTTPLYRRTLPGAGKPGFAPRIEWARLLSGSHVAAILDGALVLWDLPAAQLIYKIERVRVNEPPVFSANQVYMAVPQSGYVSIVHTATGSVLARIPSEPGASPGVSFDPSGRLLAICFSNQYLVWDCVENQIVHQATTTEHLGAHPVYWLGPKMLLSSSGDAVDLELGMSVWKYSRPSSTDTQIRGGRLLTATKVSECSLVSLEIPHAAATKSVETLMRAGDAAMLVRPGSTVAVAVETISGTNPAEIKTALTEAAEKAGWKVSDTAPITLVAKIGRGEPQELLFRKMGTGLGASSKATLTPFTAELEIRRGTDVLWTRSTANRIPPLLRLEEGETVQDAVKRYEKPDAKFFGRLNLPPRIPKPEIAASVGRSVLRDGGWYDMSGAPTSPIPPRRRR